MLGVGAKSAEKGGCEVRLFVCFAYLLTLQIDCDTDRKVVGKDKNEKKENKEKGVQCGARSLDVNGRGGSDYSSIFPKTPSSSSSTRPWDREREWW